MTTSKSESERVIDEETLDLLRARDSGLLTRLFEEVNPFLTRICLANGIFRDEVHEIIHQTWDQFFSNLEKFEGRSQIRTFVCGILFNKIREHRRFQQRFVSEENPQKYLDDAFTPEGWWKTAPMDPHK
ncbi:MAG: RNA polymerase sigma factor, partial [Pseudobdellovibrionaceae bacterium]